MRLSVIYEILKLHQNHLNITGTSENKNFRVSGVQQTIEAVREIEKTGVLKYEVGKITSITSLNETPLDSIILDSPTWNETRIAVTNLKNKVNSLCSALEDLSIQEAEDSISFKIPDNIQFIEISNIIERLNKILEQSLVNDYIKGEVRFQGFESGSSWIKLTVGGMLAIQLFGGMIDLIYEYKTEQQKFSAREKMIEDLDIQVDIKKTVYEALNKEKDEALKARMSKLREDAGIPSDDNEIDNRLKYSIKELTELMDMGLEVHPSLTAPPEIRRQFPDAEDISKTLKLLPSTKANVLPNDNG